MILPSPNNCSIAVIGAGYIGLPLSIKLAEIKKSYIDDNINKRKVLCFDINSERINDLRKGIDKTKEVEEKELLIKDNLFFTDNTKDLTSAEVFIVAVPTPINDDKTPNLYSLKEATKFISNAILEKRFNNPKKNVTPIIIYESTVYPGATEEICVPIIEKITGLKYNDLSTNKGFTLGYSPERANPADKKNTLNTITKITSGSHPKIADWVDNLYGSIIKAGTHKVSSIKIGEAAKIIENVQRDVNIALMNEFAMFFSKLDLDTHEILEAAYTKWNFLKFEPGLVGGHCIGVDPYYLIYKAKELSFSPKLTILSREINEYTLEWIFEILIREAKRKNINIKNSKILFLGISFKENCPDLRNSKSLALLKKLISHKARCDFLEPNVSKEKLKNYGANYLEIIPENGSYDILIGAVKHKEFLDINSESWLKLLKKNHIVLDIKNIIPKTIEAIRL